MDELAQLKQSIRGFNFERCSLGSQGFIRLLIQLFGFSGHGKSSFINTLKYVLDGGEFRNVAKAGRSAGGGTTARLTYPLTQTITMVDNRGCGNMDANVKGEIYAQLANLIPLDEEVEWDEGLGLIDKLFKADCRINKSDFIVPMFVYSLKKSIVPQEENDLRGLLSKARELTGMYPIVILTNKYYKNSSNIKTCFKDMGVERIFEVENYTEENHIKARTRDVEVLRFLTEVIKDIKYQMNEKLNPERDARSQMHFIVKYVCERELRKLEENKDFEKVMEVKRLEKNLNKIQSDFEKHKELEEMKHRNEQEGHRLETDMRNMEMMRNMEIMCQEIIKLKGEVQTKSHDKHKKRKKKSCLLQ